MSDITPADVAADLFAAKDTHYDDSGKAWYSLVEAVDNVLNITITPTEGDGAHEPVHFRAVVVEGDETPLVLEWPEELGMQWDDGADLLSLTPDGIVFNLRGIDEWDLDADGALELAAQLAAMAYASKLLAAREAEQNGGGS